MSVHKIVTSIEKIEIYRSANRSVFTNRSDHKGTQKEIEISAIETLQLKLDTLIERIDLPSDDPIKIIDPNTKQEFWEGTTYRSRSVRISSLSWPLGVVPILEITREL
jgi:hypothetical protein